MCWSQQLYDAMIHVYNYGMHDYTTPLMELLLQLRRNLNKSRSISGELLIVVKLLGFKMLYHCIRSVQKYWQQVTCVHQVSC